MISKGHSKLGLQRQCKLLQIHRSGLYYKPRGESKLNLELMRLMDEHYKPNGCIPGLVWTKDKRLIKNVLNVSILK